MISCFNHHLILGLSTLLIGGVPVRVPDFQLVAPDADQGLGQGFGDSVAISGDWIVVGAPFDSDVAWQSGAAYIFRRVGARWVFHEKLWGPMTYEATFGHSVAMDKDWIVVAAPQLSEGMFPGNGQAFVYRHYDHATPNDLTDDYWLVVAALHPPPSEWCCGFGMSVDVDHSAIIVGKSTDPFSGETGKAYMFAWNGAEWIGPETVVSAGTNDDEVFGWPVRVSGPLALIGALGGGSGVDRSGAAYVLKRAGGAWTHEAQLSGHDAQRGDLFGSSLGIGADYLVVGAENDRRDGGVGSAYVFIRAGDDWSHEAKLIPSGPTPTAGVGASLALDGKRVIVGARSNPVRGYVFRRDATEWVETDQLAGSALNARPAVAIRAPFVLLRNDVYAIGDSFSLRDYGRYQNCFAPGVEPIALECAGFDFEPDQQIDLRDLPLFLLTFRGP